LIRGGAPQVQAGVEQSNGPTSVYVLPHAEENGSMDAKLKRVLATATDTSSPIVLIRLAVGAIFVLEGALKFAMAERFGTGRFAQIGFPSPDLIAGWVGVWEIACGLLVLIGLGTRLASIPLIIVMIAAIISTKVPMLASQGFGVTANAARLDVAMLLCGIFLLIVGSGPYAIDAVLVRRDEATRREGLHAAPEAARS
jgi:putative oxidoreductase